MILSDVVKTGDLLFVSGNSWISKAIKRLTSGRTSHVGVIYDTGTIFETDIRWGKAEFHNINKYDNEIVCIIRCLDPIDIGFLKQICRSTEGRAYSWLDIATNAIMSPLNDAIRKKMVGFIGNKKHEICSELAGRILYECTQIKELAQYEGLTPQDLLAICLMDQRRWKVIYQHPQF